MKNEHMIPVNIIDLASKLNDVTVRENERMNYVLRLEAIRDYCETILSNDAKKNQYQKYFRKD